MSGTIAHSSASGTPFVVRTLSTINIWRASNRLRRSRSRLAQTSIIASQRDFRMRLRRRNEVLCDKFSALNALNNLD